MSILATKPSLLVVAMPVPFCSARLLATPGAVELDFPLYLSRISISSVTWDGLKSTARCETGKFRSNEREERENERRKRAVEHSSVSAGGYDEPKRTN